MSMVVRTNTMAINAEHQMRLNSSNVAKSLQKLSSGYKINSAADDAAGLAISEHMKAQIKDLDAASDNSQDGISLAQTAEGALNEVHDMLNRMSELATKASNGTYTDSQRGNYNDEVSQLQSQIDQISDSTNFNGINLLDGSLGTNGTAGVPTIDGKDALTLTTNPSTALTSTTAAVTGNTAGTTTASATTNYSFKLQSGDKVIDKTFNVVSASDSASSVDIYEDGKKVGTVGGATAGAATAADLGTAFVGILNNDADTKELGTFADGATAGTITLTSADLGSKGAKIIQDSTGAVTSTGGTDAYQSATVAADQSFTVGNQEFGVYSTQALADAATAKGINAVVAGSGDITSGVVKNTKGSLDALISDIKGKTGYAPTLNAGANGLEFKTPAGGASSSANGLTLQVGDTYNDYNQLKISINDIHASALGVGKNDIDITTQSGAGEAIKKINDAIDSVSKQRSQLGAIENRLDHTVNNLDTTSENLTSANSRIRDTDMASEMMNYTQNNVLTQAAQAMLAQANQQPSQVLQLLQ